jgi:adenylosuccinate lyase
MSTVWTDENKFDKWRKVELAVLEVRERRGEIPAGTTEGIALATFDQVNLAEVINCREREIGHDLNAFVEIMRALIINAARYPRCFDSVMSLKFHPRLIENTLAFGHPQKLDALFHEGMTSYDTEEPAMALLINQADVIVFDGLDHVLKALKELAQKYRGQVMIGRTHGQWAQPVTFGKRCLDWFEMLDRAKARFSHSCHEAIEMKLSGAVGMYGTLGPEIEAEVAKVLGLEVAKCATQIVPLDRRAQHINSLAELAAVIEKIAHDLWLLSQSEIGEVREPFGKKQKGSSAMPHKKNPITLEKLFGLPRLVRAYAHAMLENVATAHERDISHSSVERIAVPDAYGLTDHLLRQLARILEGLEVNGERMARNLAATQGTFASQEARDLLGRKGMPAEDAYRLIQQASFMAMESRQPLKRLLLNNEEFANAAALLKDDPELERIFDPAWWVRHEAVYYQRFDL